MEITKRTPAELLSKYALQLTTHQSQIREQFLSERMFIKMVRMSEQKSMRNDKFQK